ncbi:hypothetical protein [Streptomyces sp. NPDC001286]
MYRSRTAVTLDCQAAKIFSAVGKEVPLLFGDPTITRVQAADVPRDQGREERSGMAYTRRVTETVDLPQGLALLVR